MSEEMFGILLLLLPLLLLLIIIIEGNKSRGGDITPNISRSYTRWCRVGLERCGGSA